MSEIERPDRAEAHRRAETIRDGMRSYALAMEAIGLAYEARDWVTLGYKDWDTYCEKEFSERRLKLTRDQREQAVLAFRGAGMSTRAIAAALGVGDATVRRDLSGASNDAPGGVVGTDGKTYPAQQTAAERRMGDSADGVEDQVDLRSDEAPAAGDAVHQAASPAVTPEDSPAGRSPSSDMSVRSLVATPDQPEIGHPYAGEAQDPHASGGSGAGATPPVIEERTDLSGDVLPELPASAYPPGSVPLDPAGEGPAAVLHAAGHPDRADHLEALGRLFDAVDEVLGIDAFAIAQLGNQDTFDLLLNAADDLAEHVLKVQQARIEYGVDRRS